MSEFGRVFGGKFVIGDDLRLAVFSAAIFFFLASGYETLGLALLASSVFVTLYFSWQTRGCYIWLFVVLSLAPFVFFIEFSGLNEGTSTYMRRFWQGGWVFIGAIVVLRLRRLGFARILFWFSLPFFVHFLVYLFDLWIFLSHSTSTSLLEAMQTFKLAPRIGRKNLSQALVFLALLTFFGANYFAKFQTFLLAVATIALIGLVTLDTRAAYFALISGLFMGSVVALNGKGTGNFVRKFAKRRSIVVGILVVTIAGLAGGHRLNKLSDSIDAAGGQSLAWVHPTIWPAEFCRDPTTECQVDASVYLRLSWMIFGVKIILEEPLGIGATAKPLEAAIKRFVGESAESVYDDFHSDVLNFAVCFGVIGLSVLLIVLIAPIVFIASASLRKTSKIELIVGAALWGAIASRFATDSIGSGGMWFLMVVTGAFVFSLYRSRSELHLPR